jgi:LCP family protein required for cell wall assembly
MTDQRWRYEKKPNGPPGEQRKPPRRNRKKGPLEPLLRVVDGIAEMLGPWASIVGVSGLFVATITLSLFVAFILRGLIVKDALNPFKADTSLPTAPPIATPNPDFLAPTVELGNAPEWQGTDRVTILLMGADTRPSERGTSRPRSDTMILLMIDPKLKVASMLSIPRDLFVDIPGYGLGRINTAYTYGGGQLAIDTVQYNLGIRINYYVMAEFDAFVTLVDDIGGVDVYVPYDIYDPYYPDMNYGYDPFYITKGDHHLDGATALKYVRTRHTDSDFGRAQRTQDVLFAIRDRVLTLDMLPSLVQQAPAIYATISNSIETDMTLDDMVSLALLAKDIPRENIRTGIIDANYTSDYTTNQGAQVLIPNRAAIGPLLKQVFWLDQIPTTP